MPRQLSWHQGFSFRAFLNGYVIIVDGNGYRLPSDQLRRTFDPRQLKFETTRELAPLVGTVGQERAVRSMDFGFRVKTRGFNLYAAGPMGTGKHSTIESYVRQLAAEEPVPNDLCYVYNFSQPDRPVAIELPAGRAALFAKNMRELIHTCKTEIPKAFESEEYEKRKNRIMTDFQTERDALLTELREDAHTKGFSVELTTAGIVTIPIIDGRLMKRDEYDRLPDEAKEAIKKRTEELQADINRILARIRQLEKQTKEKIQELDKEITLFAMGHLLDDLRDRYKDFPKVTKYLGDVQQDIVASLETFKAPEKKAEVRVPGLELLEREPTFERYEVNVLVNNAETRGAPVVFESNPTYYNLFGRLEYQARFGAMVTDFTLIKSGAAHRANGGYLILNALDVLTNFMSWDALKRTIKNGEARIENIGEQFRVIPAATLQPQPIPAQIKVVLIGSPFIYRLLYLLDEDFKKLFKVKADFNVEMNRTGDNVDKYAALVAARCVKEGLKHFDRTGVARIVEYGSRLAEDKEKLSTRFIEINDLVSEASYWAGTNGNSYVTGADVQKAIDERIYRSNMIEQKIQEMIEDGIILIDTEGGAVGQVNGISVIDLGDYMFGKPSRITSKTFVGKGGIVNIEREAKMSGRIHNKSVMILAGYLGGKYASDKPLSMSATIGFEQLYEEIEGDSASSTELYAILSSLAEVPLKQNIAVTGSVDQRGDIQPVGAINRKIEGFYDVCKAKGLTGDQGVIIPRRNVKHLMLRDDVIDAVRREQFHVWAIDSIDEGIEILTGVPAGERRPDGTYPEGTINYLVNKRLEQFAEELKAYEVH